MDLRNEVLNAEARIRGHVRETPLVASNWLSRAGSCEVLLKLENLQHTGSFKFRGAMNKLLSLPSHQRARGVVAASSGNHGAAVAHGAAVLDSRAVIFVPRVAASSKIDAIRNYGGQVHVSGEDCVLAEAAARDYAGKHGMAYLSPYNDARIVGGQGTIGVELERQTEPSDAVFVALGGGGLIAGISGYLKSSGRSVQAVACSPRNSPVMHDSLAAGRILTMPTRPTWSDGTAGGVEADSITFELCRDLIDDSLLVDEQPIADAVRNMLDYDHLLIEGAAGVAVAGFLQTRERFAGKRVVIVLCGANIDSARLKQLFGSLGVS